MAASPSVLATTLEVQDHTEEHLRRAGAQALRGTRELHYVFDDYSAGTKSNGSVPMGKGNLL